MKFKPSLYLFLGLLSISQCFAQKNLLPIRSDYKWGFIDSAGEMVIAPKYVAVGRFNGKKYTHFATHSSLGIVSTNGKELFFKNVNAIQVLNNKVIALRKDTFWGLANFNGEQILDYKFSAIKEISNGVLKVRIGDSLGLRNNYGKPIAKTRFQNVSSINNNAFLAQLADSSYIFDAQGNIIFTASTSNIIDDYYPIIICQNQKNYDVFSATGPDSLFGIKNYTHIPNTELLIFKRKNKSGLFSASNGITIKVNGDLTGRSNANNHIRLDNNGLIGIADENGKLLIPIEFSKIELRGNYYECFLQNFMGLYTNSGQRVFPAIYDEISMHNTGVFIIQQNGKLGVAKRNGQIIIRPRFDQLEVDNNQVRGINGAEMTFFDLDNGKNVTDTYRFKNVKTIDLDARIKLSERDVRPQNDSMQFGWFQNRINRRWGFRREDSSLRHAPKFEDVIHFKPTGFTLTRESKNATKQEQVLDGYYFQNRKCALAFTANGNYFLTPKYWHIYKSELRKPNCGYVRALAYDGNQRIILRNGQVVKKVFSFIDTLEEGFARFNLGGRHILHEDGKTKTAVYNKLVYNEENGWDSSEVSVWQRQSLRNQKVEISYGKWGFINNDGSIVVEPKFDFVYQFYKGAAIAKYKGKWGVINTKGEFLIKPEYYKVERIERDGQVFFYVYKPQPRFGIIDTSGRTLLYPEYHRARNFVEDRLAVKTKKGWTFLDKNLMPICNANFDEVRDFSNGLAAVMQNRKWGYINKSGSLVIPCIYREVIDFKCERAWAQTKGTWQLIDKSGRPIGKNLFKYPSEFNANYSIAKKEKGSKYGVVNTNGEFVIRPRFHQANGFNKYGISIVKKKNLYGIIDTTGKMLTEYSFIRIDSFSSEWAYATNENGLVMLHTSGKVIDLNDDYYEVDPFINGVSRLKLAGFYGYIDTTGQIIVPFELNRATNFKNGYAFCKKPGQLPFCINYKGESVFEFSGWVQSEFTEGLAILKQKGRSVYIDTTGAAVFEQGFKRALPFSQNVGRVKIGKRWAVINRNGQILNTAKYKKIRSFNLVYSVVKRNGSYGLYDNNGNVVLDVMYDELDLYDDYYFFLSVNDRVGHYHILDGWVWQPEK
jgi:hypothetical protein